MRGKRGLMLAALIFTVAFFTKQTQIVAPASLVAGLLWRRRINDAGLFCLVLAVCSALVFGLLTAFTSGRFFLHTVAWNVNVMEWPSLERWLNHLWFWGRFKLLALVLLGIGALVAGRLVKRPEGTGPADRGDVVLPALGFYLGLSFLSLFSLAKAGSAPNYLLEFHAAFALFAVFALDRVFGVLSQEAGAIAGRSRTVLKGIAGAAVLLLTLHAAENTLALGGGDGGEFLFGRGAYYQQGPSRADSELQAYVQLAVNDAPGDVLAEWPIFTILAGKPVLYQPFIMAQLAREGRWDQSEFVRELATADRFGLIVTRNDLSGDGPFPGFTEEMRTAILAHYELRATIGPWHLYYPVGSRARLREPMRA
jgi:hypothetical protein